VTRLFSPSPDRLVTPTVPTDFGLRELMAVREIMHAFLTAEQPEEVYQLALRRISHMVGATFSCVYLIDEGSDLMRLVAAHNWPDKYAKFLGQMRVRLGSGPSGEAASERRVIEVPDLFVDHTLVDWHDAATELGFKSFVALPLETADSVIGTVTFYFASRSSISPETHHLMRIVADQMTATAEKARLIERLSAANTDLSTSNATLERQYAEVVESKRVKDEFLANISHELRTPLTAVMGYISLMQEGIAGPITGEQQRTLDHVKDASEQLLTLIGDLLELTALKHETIVASISEFDPREPIRDAIASAKGRRGQVTLEVEHPEIVPMMRSDRRVVAKTLKALIDNAFKFTREGRVGVTLQIAGDRVTYTVDDTGIGIPSEAHGLVFDEFRQVDGTRTREFSGSGLGLSLARRLAALVHGEITLTSTPGVGSRFTFELPLRSDAAPAS
jgi:signal transduction histidine kinase